MKNSKDADENISVQDLLDDELFPDITIGDDSYFISNPLMITDTITVTNDGMLPNSINVSSSSNLFSDIDDFFKPDWEGGLSEWVDYLPPLDKINDMCEKYPALKNAFEKFKIIYQMVDQDYNGNNDDS